MKKTKLATIILSVLIIVCLVSCRGKAADPAIWDEATYKENATVGEGEKEIKINIEAAGRTVVLTVKTDRDTLGSALFALGLLNDDTFFDTLNGIKADYNKDGAYWGFYKGDALADHGVNTERIAGGEEYRFVYTVV